LVTAFDTRLSAREKNPALRLLLKTVGYAAGRIADSLAAKGGKLAAPPEGFIVEGREGPLREGELERAAAWGKTIAAGK
jgi:flavodoxin I